MVMVNPLFKIPLLYLIIHLNQSTSVRKVRLTESVIIVAILQCYARTDYFPAVPPILAECPFRTLEDVPLSFNSFDEYNRVFVPLLLHEIWAQVRCDVYKYLPVSPCVKGSLSNLLTVQEVRISHRKALSSVT